MIMERARELAAPSDFKASRGWLERFIERNQLSLRHRTMHYVPKATGKLHIEAGELYYDATKFTSAASVLF